MFSFVIYAYSSNNFQRQLLFLDRMHKKDGLNHATQNVRNSSGQVKAFYRLSMFFNGLYIFSHITSQVCFHALIHCTHSSTVWNSHSHVIF